MKRNEGDEVEDEKVKKEEKKEELKFDKIGKKKKKGRLCGKRVSTQQTRDAQEREVYLFCLYRDDTDIFTLRCRDCGLCLG